MRPATVRAGLEEARALWDALDAQPTAREVRRISVSGVLAEQLARELGHGAETESVVVGGGASEPPRVGVAVHVIAGEPGEVDVAFVDEADRRGVPVVLVQLWPQADWTPPFVLSPFVVECRPGEGFPVTEIGSRIIEATGGAPELVAAVPALRASATERAIREAVARAAFLGAVGGRDRRTRTPLTLEQAGLLARLVHASSSARIDEGHVRAGAVAGLLAAGLVFREVARSTRAILPRSVADAAVAAAATWALGRAYGRFEALLGDRAER